METTLRNNSLISCQEIVRRFNLSYQTVNYYTNLGLLPVRKRKGNERLYQELEIEQNLKRISELKDQGYPLRLICKMVPNELL
ncbi:MerR family transcriptional regulator [Candidatus Omnitrophota bacterium]